LDLNLQTLVASTPPPAYQQTTGLVARSPGPLTHSYPRGDTSLGRNTNAGFNTSYVSGENMVHVSLSDGMDNNWPFGNSILESIFKVYKQKELLEDSIIIYRVQRAPERRVFYIDVGGMPPHKAMQFVERVKNEIHQRRIPNRSGGGTCLTLDTKIPLLDGRTLALTDIINEHKSGKRNWVYSINPKTKEIVPGLISWAGVTRKNAQIVKLTLDNGEIIRCTPDHKIPVLGKGKVEAKDIVPHKDSLYSFNKRHHSINDKPGSSKDDPQYEQIFQNYDNSWQFTHRMVANYFKELNEHNEMVFDSKNSSLPKKVIHHKDFNRYNNNPDNLWFMSGYDHFLLHANMSKEFWETISDEEKIRISTKKAEKIKESWNWYKSNPDLLKRRLANQSVAMKRAIKNNPKIKTRLLQNFANEQKKPWCNQQNIFNERMVSILKETVMSGITNKDEILEYLTKNEEFMDEYRTLNGPKDKNVVKLKYDVFCNTTLMKLVRYSGYSSWKAFLKSLGFSVARPSLKLKWCDEHLSILSDVMKSAPDHSKETILNLLNKNERFITLFQNNNMSTKGNSSRKQLTLNTLMTMVSSFGYRNWTEFKEKSTFYNHKVVSIEFLEEKEDTGTITVDGDELYHDYHTFALDVGVFVYNSVMDATYNPLSMLEDYFFAQTPEGRGSKVETLPGGDQLGQIDDLLYFDNKLKRGLRIPSSYLPGGAEDGASTYTDGRVGTAYIQEYRFAKFCKRLQTLIAPMFDQEFKYYLKTREINIDSSLFEVKFNEPQSFSKFRQIEIDSAQIQVFQPLADVGYMSKRFLLQRFLNLSMNEILENERLWREENADKVEKVAPGAREDDDRPDLGSLGIRPSGSGDFEDFDDPVDEPGEEGDTDLGGEEGAEAGAEPGGEEPI
jgi:hypothetical protein